MDGFQVIFFTKDRPLQLYAALESFFRATKCDPVLVTVLGPSFQDYVRVQNQFPAVVWLLEEGGFDKIYRDYVANLDDNQCLLINVDDQVWLREVDLQKAVEICVGDVEGFSFRHGHNIPGKRAEEKYYESYMTWQRRGSEGQWHYPFPTDAMYPVQIVKQILSSKESFPLRIPNDWENLGVRWMRARMHSVSNGVYACFAKGNQLESAAVVTADVNRVQNIYKNPQYGTIDQTAPALLKAEKEGYRLKWEKMWGKEYPDCFSHGKDWELEKG